MRQMRLMRQIPSEERRRDSDVTLTRLNSSWLKRLGSPLSLTLSPLGRGEGTRGQKNLVGWCFVGRGVGSLVKKTLSRTPRRGVPTF